MVLRINVNCCWFQHVLEKNLNNKLVSAATKMSEDVKAKASRSSSNTAAYPLREVVTRSSLKSFDVSSCL